MTIRELLQTGLQHYQRGQLDDAEERFREVLRRDRDCVPGLNLLGMLYVNSDRSAEAVTLIERALQTKPDDHQAHGNLGLAHQRLGEPELAEAHFRRSLQLQPENPLILQSLGTVLAERARYEEAVENFERSLRLNHNNPQCWVSLSQALAEQGRLQRAIQAAREAVKLNPRMPEALYQMAEAYRKASRFDQAAASYRKLIELDDRFLDAYLGLAVTYRQQEDSNSALALLRKTISSFPDFAPAHSALGVLQEQLGDKEAAAESFKRAIALAPEAVKPHAQLALLKGRCSSDEEIAAMENLRARAELSSDDLSELCFGLGEAYHQIGAHDQAFTAWRQANQIRAERSPYEAETRVVQRDEILSLTREMLQQAPGSQSGGPGPRMVFIIGMPRSGTSLTDQVLSAHSAVGSLGEVSYSEDMSRQVKALTGVSYPQGLLQLSEEHVQSLRESYLQRISPALTHSDIVLDKTPMNFQYLGLLARVFPDARFVHCHRNPIDNCFSIYRLPFSVDQDYAHDLTALGQHYQLYQEMMRQWHGMYPGRILDVCYESTVADLQGQAERLAAFLEIAFEPAMLEFHRVDRLVRTPSASQVRQPIYTSSVAAWRKYEAYLQPLLRCVESSSFTRDEPGL